MRAIFLLVASNHQGLRTRAVTDRFSILGIDTEKKKKKQEMTVEVARLKMEETVDVVTQRSSQKTLVTPLRLSDTPYLCHVSGVQRA